MARPHPQLEILYLDNHLLAVNKPACLPTMGAPSGQPSLHSLARQYIRRRFHKRGNVYLGVVSRLDAVASGVVIFARTSKAAARLSEQFRSRSVEKVYWAIVEGHISRESGTMVDWLVKDEARQCMRVTKRGTGAQEARLSYCCLESVPIGTLVEISLETGRKHQIRVQFAKRGHPILGDRKYGSQADFPGAIALLARKLVLKHPTTGAMIAVVAPLPRIWRRLGVHVPESD